MRTLRIPRPSNPEPVNQPSISVTPGSESVKPDLVVQRFPFASRCCYNSPACERRDRHGSSRERPRDNRSLSPLSFRAPRLDELSEDRSFVRRQTPAAGPVRRARVGLSAFPATTRPPISVIPARPGKPSSPRLTARWREQKPHGLRRTRPPLASDLSQPHWRSDGR